MHVHVMEVRWAPLAALLCMGGLCVWFMIRHYRLATARARFIKLNGCQPAASSYPHISLLLGLDFIWENAKNIINRRFARGVLERFRQYGTTHTSYLLHREIINTIDPENLEAVMKTCFDDYTIIPGRKKLMCTLFGRRCFCDD